VKNHVFREILATNNKQSKISTFPKSNTVLFKVSLPIWE